MLTQLDPTIPVPIPVHVLDKGDGTALAVIDHGSDHHPIRVTAIDATGQIWCASNPRVRIQGNWTMGRARPAATAAPMEGPIPLELVKPS